MNTLTFVGKIGKIKYSNLLDINNIKYSQILIYEKTNNEINYFPCLLPFSLYEDYEEFLTENTILEIQATVKSHIVVKNGKKDIEHRFIIEKLNFLELNEFNNEYELVDVDFFEESSLNNIDDDIPF